MKPNKTYIRQENKKSNVAHTMQVLVAVCLAAFSIDCTTSGNYGRPDADNDVDWLAQQSELLEQMQLKKLAASAVPIEVAMARVAKQGRNTHPSLVGEFSKDLSPLSGWSFAPGGSGPAADDGKLPHDCTDNANPDACWGEKLYWAKGCAACHSLDGVQQPAPSWKGLFGKQRVFTEGDPRVADEAYLRQSINEPGSQIVQGYGPVMPPMNLNEAQVEAMIGYIKTL